MKQTSPAMKRRNRWPPVINSLGSKEHKLSFCLLCRYYIMLCGACGNNTCNAGYGENKKGGKCKRCPSAYEASKKIEQDQQCELFDAWINSEYPVNQESNQPAHDQIESMVADGIGVEAMVKWFKEGGDPPWEKMQAKKRMDAISEKWSGALEALSDCETICDWNGCPSCRNRRKETT